MPSPHWRKIPIALIDDGWCKGPAYGRLFRMAKTKFTPRGPWQATGMQKLRIPKDDPRNLRIRAEELKLKAGRLVNE